MQPYIVIRKNNEVIQRISLDIDADELPGHSVEICEQIRSLGYPCRPDQLEFLPTEREAQGPDTPPRVVLTIDE